MSQPQNGEGSAPKKKMAIGWFSFTCCEDNLGLLAELLNANYDAWKKLVDLKYCRQLKTNNDYKDLDVAFIEGAISGEEEIELLKDIRLHAKYVVAVGACACTGMPSASRNDIKTEDSTFRQQFHFCRFKYTDKVMRVSDIVRVDDAVKGCPMSADGFTAAVMKYLKLFGIV